MIETLPNHYRITKKGKDSWEVRAPDGTVLSRPATLEGAIRTVNAHGDMSRKPKPALVDLGE